MSGAAGDPLLMLAETGDIAALRDQLDSWLPNGVAEVEHLFAWNVDGRSDPGTFRRDFEVRRSQIRAVLDRAFEAVAPRPYGLVGLFTFLHHECDATWEASYHFEPMWEVLKQPRPRWDQSQPWLDDDERRAGYAVLDLIDNLYFEIQGENAMTCGLVERSAQWYDDAHRHALRALDEASRLVAEINLHETRSDRDASAYAIATWVAEWTKSSAVYDNAAARAGRAVAAHLTGTSNVGELRAGVRGGEEQLLAVYDDPNVAFPGDVEAGQDWSEIRAHRFDLDALQAAASEPWLRIDDATITYIYPFSLRPYDADGGRGLYGMFEAVGEDRRLAHTGLRPPAAEDHVRTLLDGLDALRPGGCHPLVHHRFRLDDVWRGSDPAGRRYDGVVLELPDVTLHVPVGAPDDADGQVGAVLATLQAEIRLSHLGNHHVRFMGRLRDANPHEVHVAMRRAAPEHGAMLVVLGEQRWARLATLAMELVEDLARGMAAIKTAREGMFQVLLTVDAASTGPLARGRNASAAGPADAPLGSEVTTVEQLAAARGAGVLFNPVTHVMTSFAQWSRYTVPPQVFVVDRSAGLGLATARTANTTVHVGLGTPHWYLDTVTNVSEFVASLEGLHGRWMEQLTEYHIDLNAQRVLLDETMSSPRPRAAVLRAQADLLRDRRLRFQTFVTDCLSTTALIKSPSLVRSPVVAENLAVLDAAGGGQRREEEFKRRSDEVLSDDLQGVIDEAALRLESAEAAQRRGWMDTLLAVIAAVGVSGLAQILQAGYGFRGIVSLEFTVGIVVLATLVGVYTALSAVRTGGSTTRARGGQDRSTGAAAAARSTPPAVPRQLRPRHERAAQR